MSVSQDLSNPASVADFLREHPICALYFTTPDCGICKVLKPRLVQMLTERFPEMGFGQVDCAAALPWRRIRACSRFPP